jgi:hypothetical protein
MMPALPPSPPPAPSAAPPIFDIDEIKASTPRTIALIGAILVAASYFMVGWEIDIDYSDDYSGVDYSDTNEEDIKDADGAGPMFFLSLGAVAACGLTRSFWDKNAGPGYQHKIMLGLAIGTVFFAYQIWSDMSEAEEDLEDMEDNLEDSAYAYDIDIDFKKKMGANAMLVGALLLLGGSGMYFQETNPKI